MADELKWQRYRMDLPLKSARTTVYAVFNRPPGAAVATRKAPGLLMSFRDAPQLVSLSSDGKVRWRRKMDAAVKAIAIEGVDEAVFVALSDGTVFFLGPDGKPQWKYRTDGQVAAMAASEKGGCAAIADAGGRLLMLGIDGKPVFDTRLASPAASLFLSQDGSTAVCVDTGGGVSLISREGKVLWRKVFGAGIADMATTRGCTKTVVLSGQVHGLSLDGSERWSAEVPTRTAAVRMSEDGETIYAIGPKTVVRLGPTGKNLWDNEQKSLPSEASVWPGMKMLMLPSQEGTNIVDRWGNEALQCPLPAAAGQGSCRSLFDGKRCLFTLGDDGSSTHLFIADMGPALVEYLLRAARVFGDECVKIGQPSPFGDRHYLEATSAAKSGDYGRTMENAQFSYRYYEETLGSIQHPTDSLANTESLAAVNLSVRRELEAPQTKRKRLYQAKCPCGAISNVFTPELPLMVRCDYCGKLGLVKTAPPSK